MFAWVLGLYVLAARALASSDVFETVLGSTASCHKSCEMTYSLHTYPRVSYSSCYEKSFQLAMLSEANIL